MVRIFGKYTPKTAIAEAMKVRARLYTGKFPPPSMAEGLKIVDACRVQIEKPDLITLLAYTMDDGMHPVGWWKNPDYARCYHLSISYWYPGELARTAPKNEKETAEWITLFFHPNEGWIWCEPPHYGIGKQRDVWHYRLFADGHWQPIKPEGEVYSRLKTESGWLSYSELKDKAEQLIKKVKEMEG